ncbi:MAG TPA: TIGR01777 family oxidoreductase [Flavobacteriales bacterium]|nr:TIGR01777 family oxidoreductase [Flavobacteriales bacterium]
MATILITGASGLIGNALSGALEAQGHRIHKLGRGPSNPAQNIYQWDLAKGTLDERCLEGVSHIVHLAGAGIADKRWTRTRLNELIDSRAASAGLLHSAVERSGQRIDAFVSAAGINYYGAVTTNKVFTEADPAGNDTIAHISVEWEKAVDEWQAHTRVVKLRTPMVLAREGGALKKLALPVRWGAGAALGSGKQWVPWVHLHDLVRIYLASLFNVGYRGAYNVNTGMDVTNDTLMGTLAQVMKRPYVLPNVPGFMLRIALGELADILLAGSRASNERLLALGFTFEHRELKSALRDLMG